MADKDSNDFGNFYYSAPEPSAGLDQFSINSNPSSQSSSSRNAPPSVSIDISDSFDFKSQIAHITNSTASSMADKDSNDFGNFYYSAPEPSAGLDQFSINSNPSSQSSSSRNAPPSVSIDISDSFDFKSQIAQQVASKLSTNARGFLDFYANIELIKPYFQVTEKDLLIRISQTFIPNGKSDLITKSSDLYGPTLIFFTLIAIILLAMKLSHTSVSDGTLVGTAMTACFTYWVAVSLLFYSLCYLCTVSISLFQILSIFGYSLFSVAVTLVVHCIAEGTIWDQATLFAIGISSSLSLGALFFSNSQNKKYGTVIGAVASVSHFVFILYLRVYYAHFYRAVASLHQ
eukprot:TRINITY_DN8190_c0_g1_i2.p1 TRINITY_DN8190_c0_g1~~TRINITY_DN8190_c0_g1_i2.p1  ORF type:complete len:361 (+),score=98.25 TRINITY_DN8190_c0_g1_i2:49-1083(+)